MKTIVKVCLVLSFALTSQISTANQSTGNVVNSAPLSIDGSWDRPTTQKRKRPLSNAQIIKQARKKNTRRNVKMLAKQIEVMEIAPEKVGEIMKDEDQKLADELNSAFNE